MESKRTPGPARPGYGEKSRLRRALELGCALAFCLTLVLSAALARYGALCRRVCGDTLRLHIVANSNSVQDQLLKLRVRDAVLDAVAAVTAGAADRDQAAGAVSRALPYLQQVCRRAAGGEQAVCLRLEEAEFPARDYGEFRLPAGRYTALRIELGRAQGRNWFCVLYPALCVGSSGARYRDEAENALVFGRYELRCALYDSLRALWQGAGDASVPPAGAGD